MHSWKCESVNLSQRGALPQQIEGSSSQLIKIQKIRLSCQQRTRIIKNCRERAGNLAVTGPEHPNNSFESYAYCATTRAKFRQTAGGGNWGVHPTTWSGCGLNPPGVATHCKLNEVGSHGHEPVAGLAGWLTLRRRAMDLVRLSFRFKKVAPSRTLR